MKRRVVALALSAAMAVSLAACGNSDSSNTTTAAQEADTKEAGEDTTAANTDADASDIKIGIVTDTGGVNDGSFNQSAWEGLKRAESELGITVNYLESHADADYKPNIESFIDEDYDLIICVGYQLAEALKEEATANPDVNFAIIDDSTNADLENVTCLMFEQSQASYLVGYVAGLTTESNKVGFVIGMVTDTMNEFGFGYIAGALDANADVEVLQANANSFADTAQGKSLANTMITNGADVIFHAAGGTGLGVIDACKEAGKWAIGVDSDQSVIAPETILTSAMKRVDNACYDAAVAVVNGTLENGVKVYDLASGGVDIAPTTDNLSEEVLSQIEDLKAQIIAGEVVVPKTAEEFEAKYGEDAYTLD